MTVRVAIAVGLVCLTRPPAHAQQWSGAVSVLADTFPNRARTPELRSRALVRTTIDAGARVRFTLAGLAEGLVAGGEGSGRDGIAEADDVSMDLTAARFDLRAGFTRAIWGRLDEIQPTDVINPLDLSHFFFEGREAARLPVALVRGRWHFSESKVLEVVFVPRFRPGRFDRLDEATSPFSPTGDTGSTTVVRRPSGAMWRASQGGGRFTSSTRRVDWTVGAYRGFRPLPVYRISGGAGPDAPGVLIEGSYPGFTMVSGDFETAFQRWAIRGEAVVSRDDAVPSSRGLALSRGRIVQAGLGADRSLAGYRVLGEILYKWVALDPGAIPADPLSADPAAFDRHAVSAVLVAERRFARETRVLRAFGIYDATARNGVVRGVASIQLARRLWAETAVGWFLGRRSGALGPFIDSDFLYVRLTSRF